MNLINLLIDWKADWYKILIPVIVGILALVGLIFILYKIFSRKRKTEADKTLEDRELIAANSKAVEALVVLAKDNDSLLEELKALQEKLKYLIPTEESKIVDYDKKIKNLIGDMRIALTKSDGEDSKKTEGILTDLKLAIADRNAKL